MRSADKAEPRIAVAITLTLNGRTFSVSETLDGSDLKLCPKCAGRGWVTRTSAEPFTQPAPAFGQMMAEHVRQIAETEPCDCGAWDTRKGPRAAELGRAA